VTPFVPEPGAGSPGAGAPGREARDLVAERFSVAVGGCALSVVLHLPSGPARVPLVLACHGLGASKDSDKYLLLAETLPQAGLALARFDFRGCGESSGVERDTTVATRIEDVLAVLDRLRGHPRLDGRLGLLGSSMGGFVALHVAGTLDGVTPTVVTWNAPANLLDLKPPDPPMALGAAFMSELRSGRNAETPSGISRHLIVQAACDDVVPLGHGRALYERAREPRRLVLIADADHRLTVMEHRLEALTVSRDWLLRFLATSGRPS
jgi:alpha-beta hydrolase superfamily lysophospholipase